jgi:hypothetical protein
MRDTGVRTWEVHAPGRRPLPAFLYRASVAASSPELLASSGDGDGLGEDPKPGPVALGVGVWGARDRASATLADPR